MSTPYVGLKAVLQKARFDGENPWRLDGLNITEHSEEYRRTIKRRLVEVLESRFGVQSIQVGYCQVALSEEVPGKPLLNSAQTLLEEFKLDSLPPKHLDLLQECVNAFQRTL